MVPKKNKESKENIINEITVFCKCCGSCRTISLKNKINKAISLTRKEYEEEIKDLRIELQIFQETNRNLHKKIESIRKQVAKEIFMDMVYLIDVIGIDDAYTLMKRLEQKHLKEGE